jgi:hypothetical protein
LTNATPTQGTIPTATIDNFDMRVTAAGGDTTIAIKSSGTDVTQNLVLKGVDLTALGNNDTAIIHDLLTKGKLMTD